MPVAFRVKFKVHSRAQGPPQAPLPLPGLGMPRHVHRCGRWEPAMAPKVPTLLCMPCTILSLLWTGPVTIMGLSLSSLLYLIPSEQNEDREVLLLSLEKQSAILWRGPHGGGGRGPLGADSSPQPTASREMGTSVLQCKELDSTNHR